MRKGQEYDCRPNLSLSLGTCQPFLAMFNMRQEECFKSQRRGVSASRPPALFLLLCGFPLVQLLLFKVCGGTHRCLASRWSAGTYGKGGKTECGIRFWSVDQIQSENGSGQICCSRTASLYSWSMCQHWWWGYHSSGKPVELFFH